jgi:glutamate synthase domain-containing protein 3
MRLTLIGEGNDYVGKGLSGGVLVLRPPEGAELPEEKNVIMGNTVLYGAIAGRLFAAGRAGERFAVRNSGAVAVVEGVGDHGCEYMTGGMVVVLGEAGRNFAAGMTGGEAFVLDGSGRFKERCNHELVLLTRLDEADQADETRLKALIEEHRAATGSPLAALVLARWADHKARFWKVHPRSSPAKTESLIATKE